MKSPEVSAENNPPSLKDLVYSGNAEALDELGAKCPELITILEKITAPDVSNEEFFGAVGDFNRSYMKEKAGTYETISISSDHGDITVKYYKNGSISISASWQK